MTDQTDAAAVSAAPPPAPADTAMTQEAAPDAAQPHVPAFDIAQAICASTNVPQLYDHLKEKVQVPDGEALQKIYDDIKANPEQVKRFNQVLEQTISISSAAEAASKELHAQNLQRASDKSLLEEHGRVGFELAKKNLSEWGTKYGIEADIVQGLPASALLGLSNKLNAEREAAANQTMNKALKSFKPNRRVASLQTSILVDPDLYKFKLF